ncbi:SusC/RagA family TonB-linked outer membrane protein [Chryseosolibacter indicus]|uniref:SusC/RagA family TonB-linked outer membrane protein n=1 Tax=Chryseosolibacter indicus TaxID=2782351 RepID=A0ABS5VUM9_9BACT|nr:SusC/RagA family TonB-linked outer membrane protein [Chryseosolibacter indicus]MBT1704527.1 SusC/RagA family TonB-linked outer membrane protein [Chryseosolibacter indicus]
MQKFLQILFLCLMLPLSHVLAQGRTISGRVVAADQSALPGVNIVQEGTTNGTVTDANGNYSITVNEGTGNLVFTFIGYQTVTRPIGDQTTINVTLSEDTQQLSEVVVTALGIEREAKALGYSVQEIQGESITRVKETNVVNSLQGRIAGVQIQGNQGALGGSSRILIRGARSIANENQPLFVVDGIPLDNSNFNSTDVQRGAGGYDYGNAAQDVNPEDIESVNVLKGPSAAALYGNRAANGVIIITTKKGAKRKGIGVDVSSDIQFQDILILPDYQNQYGGGAGPFSRNERGEDVALFYVDESWGPRLDGRPVRQYYSYYPEFPEFYNKTTPWVAHPNNVRDFFELGIQNTNSIAFNGGNEKGTFRLAYTNLNAKGIMPNSDLDRNTINFNGSFNLTDKLTASAGVNYINSTAQGRPEQGYSDVMVQFNTFGQRQVDMDILDRYWITATGEQVSWNRDSEDNPRPRYSDNPYWIRRKNYQNDSRDRIFGNVTLSYQFNKWLKLTGRIMNDFYTDRREERKATGSVGQSFYISEIRQVRETNADLILTFTGNVTNNLSLTAFVGGNIRENHYNLDAGETVGGLSVPDFFNLQNSMQRPIITDNTSQRNINSVFGSVSLGYRDLIYVDGTLRNDWSSTLPSGNNSFLYPSISASFLLSSLPVFEGSQQISLAKVRGSYAEAGNDTDPYRTGFTYEPQNYFGSNPSYRVPVTLNNPELKPEKTRSYEFGVDLRFFDDRLTFDATYYHTISTDQIFQVPVSGASGYTSQIINAGRVRNNGIEIALSGAPVVTENFRWDIGINWARNRNRLLELPEGIENYRIATGPFAVTIDARVGQPLGVITGYDYVYQDGKKVVDDNGVYAFSDQLVPLGSVLADWTGGLTSSFNYKGINLSFLFSAQYGGELYSLTSTFGKYSGMMEETVAGNIRQQYMVVDGVKEDEDGNFVPNDIEISPVDFFASMFGHGRAFVYDASFVKLREISLGYSLPQSLIANTPFRSISFSLIGRNLAILYKNVPHLDPEAAVTGSGNIQGYEGGAIPSLRSYGASIRLGF